MKIISLFILLFLSTLLAQYRAILAPHPVQNGIRFSFSQDELKKTNKLEFVKIKELEIKTIAVAGSFNNWNKNQYLMKYDSMETLWSVDIPLREGVEYHYKFVINDSIWITDPNTPDMTEDEWQNGIVIPYGYNKPFAVNLDPPYGKRITKLQDFTCRLVSLQGKILKSSIECFLNGEKIKFFYNERTNQIRIRLPQKISEGEHKILLKFADDTGNRNDGFLTKFFLDRHKAKIQTPKFYDSSIVYEIFIRKFYDSDGDGIGDFKGLTEKLDYLESLGINTLWLMPFNESSKDHGYNVIDYYKIEKDYGTFNDYINFLRECKKRNIKVIKDIVINHCDTSFVLFKEAKNNPSSKYSSWFQFTDSLNSTWNHFGIEIDMPKFNFENIEVQDYFIEFVKYWIDPNKDGNFDDGIDGIRCDAAKEIPHSFWNKLRKEIKKIRSDFLILGEVWDGANYLIPFFEDEFDMLFDYPFYYSIQRFFDTGNSVFIKNILINQTEIYPANFQMLKFLSNHDNHRSLSLFNIDTIKLAQALVMLFTLPGTPMIYYGDEIGMIGTTPPENVRQKMEWGVLQNNLILHLYKKLVQIRKQNSALFARFDSKNQSLKFLETNESKILAYIRKNKKEKFLVVVNNSNKDSFKVNLNLKLKINKGKIIFALMDYLKNRNGERELELKELSIKPRDAIIVKLYQ